MLTKRLTRCCAVIFMTGVAMSPVLEAHPAAAQTDSTYFYRYRLGALSNFQTGCFGPCACPVLISSPLEGTFTLKHVGFDGLFDRYSVSDVRWVVPDNTTTLTIQGAGTYRVGGEVAVQQQMSLDLSVSGGPIQHFDSGLIAGGGGFPKIDITISLHQNTACRDTMMRVEASPYYTASGIATGAIGNSAALDRVSPNPFGGQVKLRLTLAHPGPVEIVVYDLGGRIVRSLANGAWFTAGEHTLSWDGRCDSGASSSAGVYFVRAQAGGDRFVRRVVKVE